MTRESFNFTPEFENLLLSCLIKEPENFVAYSNLLAPSYFSTVDAGFVCKVVTSYQVKYGKMPTWPVVGQMLANEYGKLNRTEEAAISYVNHLREIDTSDWEFVRNTFVGFCREKAVIDAAQKTVKCIEEGKMEQSGVVGLFEQALSVGQNLFRRAVRNGQDLVEDLTIGVMYFSEIGPINRNG